jgi:hypothetical protein
MIPTSVLTHLTRVPGVRNLWRKYQWGRFETRVRFGICRRPHYAYGVHRAALLAKSLGLKSISVFEFGVAGGNGLLALESLAQEVSRLVGIHIATYGFDTGTGMPPPKGYRDLPYIWEEGFYKMEPEKLRERLTTAKLVLGDVRETIPALMNVVGFEPVGFIAFDLDYYSSTKDAFQVFVENPETRLPRVYSYFDDIYWPEARVPQSLHRRAGGDPRVQRGVRVSQALPHQHARMDAAVSKRVAGADLRDARLPSPALFGEHHA